MSQHPFQNFMVRYPCGQAVFTEGDAGTTMYIVQSGKVGLSREVNGQDQPLGVMEKGDFFGEMSILEGRARTMSARTIEDAELIEINSAIFDKMIRGNIEIAIRMLRKLSIRLRETQRRLSEYQAASGARAVSSTGTPTTTASRPSELPATGVRLETSEGTPAYAVPKPETLIGRYDPVTELMPDIDLTDLDLKRSVSRRHAKIIVTEQGHAMVEEVGALSGTSVNGTKLVPGKPHPVRDGDRVCVGKVELVFRTA